MSGMGNEDESEQCVWVPSSLVGRVWCDTHKRVASDCVRGHQKARDALIEMAFAQRDNWRGQADLWRRLAWFSAVVMVVEGLALLVLLINC